MKRITVLVVLLLMSLSWAGCAPKKAEEKIRIKCPACGYEFDAPAKD